MKKLFTLALASVCMLLVNSAFAQRTIDWSVEELIKPTELNSTDNQGTPMPIHCVFKNNGTDTVYTTDSFAINALLATRNNQVLTGWPSSSPTSYLVFPITKRLNPGDTMHYINNLTVNLRANFSLEMRVIVNSNLVNRSSNSISDGTITNNAAFNDVIWYNPQKWGVSINEYNNGVFAVAPNPVMDDLNINLNVHNNNEVVNVEVVDITGKVVKSEEFAAGTLNMSLNTSDLVNGVYLVRVKNGELTSTTKVVVSK